MFLHSNIILILLSIFNKAANLSLEGLNNVISIWKKIFRNPASKLCVKIILEYVDNVAELVKSNLMLPTTKNSVNWRYLHFVLCSNCWRDYVCCMYVDIIIMTYFNWLQDKVNICRHKSVFLLFETLFIFLKPSFRIYLHQNFSTFLHQSCKWWKLLQGIKHHKNNKYNSMCTRNFCTYKKKWLFLTFWKFCKFPII